MPHQEQYALQYQGMISAGAVNKALMMMSTKRTSRWVRRQVARDDDEGDKEDENEKNVKITDRIA